MGRCDMCGNEYERSFLVTMAGAEHTFDCFECAITALAPECHHCGCRIIGHGVEYDRNNYCCSHCVRASHASIEHSDHVLPDT